MATEVERNWTANIVIASAHAGLKPHFAALEAEILRVLARVDDPKMVRGYLRYLVERSEDYLLPGAIKRASK